MNTTTASVVLTLGSDCRPRADHYPPAAAHDEFVAVHLGVRESLHIYDPVVAERLAQAFLDAANLLREPDDPPVTAQHIEDVCAPFVAPVTARMHEAEVPA